jgi:hypothetical protein
MRQIILHNTTLECNICKYNKRVLRIGHILDGTCVHTLQQSRVRAKAGIGIGVTAGVIVLAVLGYFIYRQRSKTKQLAEQIQMIAQRERTIRIRRRRYLLLIHCMGIDLRMGAWRGMSLRFGTKTK